LDNEVAGLGQSHEVGRPEAARASVGHLSLPGLVHHQEHGAVGQWRAGHGRFREQVQPRVLDRPGHVLKPRLVLQMA
jgi:hypothetical protein